MCERKKTPYQKRFGIIVNNWTLLKCKRFQILILFKMREKRTGTKIDQFETYLSNFELHKPCRNITGPLSTKKNLFKN